MDSRSLKILPGLTVSDIIVEPKRVKATYSVIKEGGDKVKNELIYSYDQAYFLPNTWTDINLASMMVAQVALNYGLFFEEIIFDGIYDNNDQRFIHEMLENTSREILVNKFLSTNEFLKSPYNAISPTKLERYTNASVVFKNTKHSHIAKDINPSNKDVDYNKYTILSSGGKDSLLTYGLINEIGDPHPVFINESGRHWYTAINSYKYLKEHESNTAKPWCNSDRIFNWMLRQFPFIKENFQSIKADIYPIRLWTVSVFLFGVLPIALKRGLGNILIGNEYDTTVKSNFKGITHYNALYDQSKYFDNYLSRYYRKKGWHIYQYSILRSLSELLILKILVKRYPQLQKHQVSCHASHEKEGRIYPCGNCEKCRRIVGMLKALKEDPSRCGYTNEQIDNGLQKLSKLTVKQLGSDAAQLYHILLQNGIIESNEHTKRLAKEHPEILKLRFDSERSLMADMPEHIRQPLFDIYSRYAEGIVQLQNRKWVDMELDSQIEKPFHLN